MVDIMTVEEFMLKPIINKALDNLNFEQLEFIKHNNMFSASENINIDSTNIMPIGTSSENAYYNGQLGSSCKLYYNCKKCGVEHFYHEFTHNYNWRKNKVCKKCISGSL